MQNQNKKNYGIALFLILIGFTFNSHGDEFDNEQPTVLKHRGLIEILDLNS
ncbi:MAG: hypothetical protein Ct9H300mP6_10120 [Gammaproteobacteria bacterium]|nr:MAG: hypothetical protein Ct9H300mP6_10120 [Gammaproteobacteria bacterium]